MSFIVDEDFQWFLEQFGQPQNITSVTQMAVEKYTGQLPPRLLDYWAEYGFCSFNNGLISLVNPDDYTDVVNTWLKGTGVLELDKFHVIARSGFGVMYLWGENSGQSWNIEPLEGRIFHNGNDEEKIKNGKANDLVQEFFGVISKDNLDLKDRETRKHIFDIATSRFGALNDEEMFTFEPAPFLGGARTLKSLNKVNFFIQCEILAGMGQREIMDISGLATKAFGG